MKLIKMECPYCGGTLEYEEGQKAVTCKYCGKEVHIDDEKQKSVVTIKDEAKIKEADLKQQQYEDEKKDRERLAKKAFLKGKLGKLVIALIIIFIIAALIAFGTHHILAGILALLQTALLVTAVLIATGTVETIKGKHIPYGVLLAVALILIVPFFMLAAQKAKPTEKLVWPSSELADLLPEPDSKYGEVHQNDNDYFSVDVYRFSEEKYQNYLSECKDKGFTVDAQNGTSSYEAADAEGNILNLRYSDDEMDIRLEAAAEYKDFTWPVRDIVSALPEPPVTRGNIVSDSSDYFRIEIPDMDDSKFSEYVDAVLNAGFNVDYENHDHYFTGKDGNGIEVSLSKETGNIMQMTVETYDPDPAEETEETEEAEAAPASAPTPEAAATPEETAAPAQESTPVPTPEATVETARTGIRPEFQAAMESYEAFFDSYCDFMKTYDSSDLTMLAKYTQMMTQYADTMQKLDEVDESELSPEEDNLYLQTMLRINNKLAETAQYVGN